MMIGFLILFGACTPLMNQSTNLIANNQNPRIADVPAAPVLDILRPNPDYDKNVYLQWAAVNGATSYKVYRNATEILDVSGWTPVGTPTTTKYVDNSIVDAGTYWYAVVATNTSGDSGLSNSLSTVVGAGGSDLVFWEDFDNDTGDANPSPWTSNHVMGSTVFCARNSWGVGTDHPTPYLDVSDNQAGSYVWGYANLPTTLTDGTLAFDVHTCPGTGGGSDLKEYMLKLQTSGGSTIATFKISQYTVAGYWYVSLDSTSNTTQLGQDSWSHLILTFAGNKLSLTLNGTPVLTNIAYAGGTVGRLRFETTVPMSGGGCHFDNIMVKNSTALPPEPINGIPFTLEPGTQQVVVKDFDYVSVICEFTITVLTTIQMVVSAENNNPTSTDLLNGLRYFTIEVLSGTYASTIIPVKFYYKDSGLSASAESQLKVHYYSGSSWSNIGGQVYASPNYVFINLDHFSTYAIVAPINNGTPEPIPVEYIVGAILAFLATLGIYLVFKLRGKKGGSGAAPAEVDFFEEFDL